MNDFNPNFNPCNIVNFKHLVCVNIFQGNSKLFDVIDFITAAIGALVKAWLGSNHRHISVVVESTLKLFPAWEQFLLENSEVTIVLFD